MTTTDLRASLRSLHDQLSSTPELDPDSRRLLADVLQDIQRVLDETDPAHKHRLEALATRFEADHPDLAGVLRQFVDALGRAGL